MRKPPTETRRAIRRAALIAFSRRGYRGTTLQEIASEVGLTRGAVLHHFNSKAELLAAVVDPYLGVLDATLDAADVTDPPTVEQQRRLLRDVANLTLHHRAAVELLTRDITARDELGSTDLWDARAQRLATLLSGTHAGAADQVRATAAVGAIVHPVATERIDMDSADARSALIDASLAALGVAGREPKGGN